MPASSMWLDRLGSALSGTCAVHCGLWPVVATLTPMLWWEKYDAWLWALAALVSIVAIGWGWKAHRSWGPVLCALVAWVWAACIWIWDLGHQILWMTGVLLVISHLWNNHRFKKLCIHNAPTHRPI